MNLLLEIILNITLLICISGIFETVYSSGFLNHALRGKGGKGGKGKNEEEYIEKVLSSLNMQNRSFSDDEGYKEDAKRGSVNIIRSWTVYRSNNQPFKDNIRNLCLHGHNFLRGKHISTPSVNYDETIAKGAESYAASLASSGRFQHDQKISGRLGENLYRMDNTYDLYATPIHAVMAWYEESWKPLNGPKKNYNYNWNPKTSAEFFNAGVGHFTQFVWDTSTRIGCGVATTTFSSGGRKWTRTVIATRYGNPGNLLGTFPKHIKPLSGGKKTLEGLKRGKLYTADTKCVNTVNPKNCADWKKFKWCDRDWAKRDCYCTCG